MYASLDKGKKVKYTETPIPPDFLDHMICASSESMQELPDSSIHLMVTSPPYNAQKEYDEDLSLAEYLNLLESVWRKLTGFSFPAEGLAINVAKLGRKPYLPLHSLIIEQMLSIGYLMRGEVIWDKAPPAPALPPPGEAGVLPVIRS